MRPGRWISHVEFSDHYFCGSELDLIDPTPESDGFFTDVLEESDPNHLNL